MCRFGNSCVYLHAQELYRPTLSEQTASLLQAVQQLILFAVSCLQHTCVAQAPAFAAEQRQEPVEDDELKHNDEDLLSTEAKSEPLKPTDAFDAKPARQNLAGIDKQSDIVEFDEAVPVIHHEDTKDTPKQFLEEKVDLSSASKLLGAQKEEKLWRFVLANAPQKLVAKYPKLLHEFQKQHYLGDMDAVLTGLKKDDLNGKPVIIKGRNHSKQRFIVEIHEHSKTPRSLLIKNENLQTLRPRPGSDAFQLFKDDIETDSWSILSVNDCCYHNENLLRFFVNHQFIYYDARTATKDGYTMLCTDAVKYAKERGLGVTNKDCTKILSLLYSLCFQRKLHIVRVFEIPLTWTPQKWTDKLELFVLLPPND